VKIPEADVLIVGAGTAGAVLAARLSEDPDRTVLLLDEGPDLGLAERPGRLTAAHTVPSPVRDHRFTAWHEVELPGGRTIPAVRGRVVGGSSAVNGTYFVRGTPGDFHRWAAVAGPGWSYDRVLPYYRRLEHDLDHPGGPFHGDSGPMPVRRAQRGDWTLVTTAFVDAAVSIGFPVEEDKNIPGSPGVGPVPCNSVGGRRVSVAEAYLDPARDRPNLHVLGGIRVRSVVIERGRAVGVEVDGGRSSQVVRAAEVVLSAGAIGSPRLLMLSGLGPADELLANGIEVIADLPGVGALRDHPGIDLYWLPDPQVTGPPGEPGGPNFQVALNIDGDGDGAIELLTMTHPYGLASGDDAADRRLSLRVGIQQPDSMGRVTIDSANPHAPPVVRSGHLTEASDRELARRAVRLGVQLLQSSPFARLMVGDPPVEPVVLGDDTELDRWIAAHVGTAMHPMGTCAMGLDGDPPGVVDPQCRVRGVDGLWVVDTSVIPAVTSRGPAATAVMLGERGADLLAQRPA
jgi:choline dehydrogenase